MVMIVCPLVEISVFLSCTTFLLLFPDGLFELMLFWRVCISATAAFFFFFLPCSPSLFHYIETITLLF